MKAALGRAARASSPACGPAARRPALLDAVRVDYYGNPTPINQMASVSVPDAAHDRDPAVGGRAARRRSRRPSRSPTSGSRRSTTASSSASPCRRLTEERRKQLAKTVGKIAEDARVAIRNVRREANDKLKALAKDKKVSRGRGAARPRPDPEDDRPVHRQGRRAAEEEGAGDPRRSERAADGADRLALGPTLPMARGLGEPRARCAARCRAQPVPAPRRGHHGRQRPLGDAARAAARGRPPRGRQGGARDRAGRPTRSGSSYLTLYAFSTENWNRPERRSLDADDACWSASIDRELPELMERNVRLRVIGRAARRAAARCAAASTTSCTRRARNTGLTLLMAFNYGGRDELLDAFRALAARRCRRASSRPEDIDEAHVSRALYTDGMPDPDLLIRTSGEMRMSNFLLWQIAYTELWMTPTLWPDFGAARPLPRGRRLPAARPPLRRGVTWRRPRRPLAARRAREAGAAEAASAERGWCCCPVFLLIVVEAPGVAVQRARGARRRRSRLWELTRHVRAGGRGPCTACSALRGAASR